MAEKSIFTLLKQLIERDKDYVIETNADYPDYTNGWRWRKWKSGLAELDVYVSEEILPYANNLRIICTTDLPFPLKKPIGTVQVKVGSGIGWTVAFLGYSTTNSTGFVDGKILALCDSNLSGQQKVYSVGRLTGMWK